MHSQNFKVLSFIPKHFLFFGHSPHPPHPVLFFMCFITAVFLNFLAWEFFKCPFTFDVFHHPRRTWSDPVQIYIMAHYKVLWSNSRQIFHGQLEKNVFLSSLHLECLLQGHNVIVLFVMPWFFCVTEFNMLWDLYCFQNLPFCIQHLECISFWKTTIFSH